MAHVDDNQPGCLEAFICFLFACVFGAILVWAAP